MRNHFVSKFFLMMMILSALLIFGATWAFSGGSEYNTPTPTPENILGIDALNTLINDPDCMLPCWWGLTLGESTLSEVKLHLNTYLGRPLNREGTDEGEYIRVGGVIPDDDPNLYVDRTSTTLGFWIDKSTDWVIASGLKVEYPTSTTVDYSRYFPSGILASYGTPSNVTISYYDWRDELSLNFLYVDLGLYLQYFTELDEVSFSQEDTLAICNIPLNLASVNIWVQTPYPIAFSDAMIQAFWHSLVERGAIEYDLEGVSDLSLVEFTDLFSQPNACFQTLPLDQWRQFATPESTPTSSPVSIESNDDYQQVQQVATATPSSANEIVAIDWSPDGKYIAIQFRDRITIYDPELNEIEVISMQPIGNNLAWSPDSTRLAFFYLDQQYFFEIRSINDLQTPLIRVEVRSSGSLSWNPDGNQVVIAASVVETVNYETTFLTFDTTVIDANTGAIVYDLPEAPLVSPQIVAWSPDGQYIVASDGGDQIIVWNAAQGTVAKVLSAPPRAAYLVWSPDGTILAQSFSYGVALWNIEEEQIILTLTPATNFGAVGRLLNLQGDILIAEDFNAERQILYFWQASTGELIRTLNTSASPVYALALSPDGTQAVYGGIGGTLHLICVATDFITPTSDPEATPTCNE